MQSQIWLKHHGTTDQHQRLVDVGLGDWTDLDCFQGPGPNHQDGWIYIRTSPTQRGPLDGEIEWLSALPVDGPAGRYHIGFAKGQNPTPMDLARPYQFPGVWRSLGDGHRWLIPIPKQIPPAMVYQADGTIGFQPLRQMHGHFIRATYVDQVHAWEKLLLSADGFTQINVDELMSFAMEALKVNYFITPEVINRLQLLTTQLAKEIMFAAVGAITAKDLAEVLK